ncbi:hypothetical protein CVT24_000779 [Panaeolus cyanescens]|uniref:Uncharacterized protein n=1 Tax=Panaeolus cyanescens TaxID=181874 RepID=A0A409YCN5_9AGAR|nr:hypothetical protein CVT24_000779 [Panaeolus cyanescens]
MRRTATSVMAGAFDVRPPRDVLTSLLNGIGPYKEVESDEAKQKRRKERKEREREKKKEKAAAQRLRHTELIGDTACSSSISALNPNSLSLSASAPIASSSTHPAWRARPTIHIPAMQRLSVTPSPPPSPQRLASTPGSTPGPSISSSTSRSSSKRPHTPDDHDRYDGFRLTVPLPKPPRKKRAAAKKGWKGWVEGSPPPSDKLINLDSAPVLQERRTRSGKNFDAISVGKDGWV